MKMYLLSNGIYYPTQAEAAKIARIRGHTFKPVDVPVKLRELVDYLNDLPRPDHAPAPIPVDPVPVIKAPLSYTDWSVAVDENWEKLPLARKLHFAALAMEAARDLIKNQVDPPVRATPLPPTVWED